LANSFLTPPPPRAHEGRVAAHELIRDVLTALGYAVELYDRAP
jgi:hypothetical protein